MYSDSMDWGLWQTVKLDALWEKALAEDAVPWNDAEPDEVTEREREEFWETFPEQIEEVDEC